MSNVLLKDCGEFVSEKIPVKDITLKNYISTDNMLPNKQGICDAVKLPPVEYVSHYKKDDILLSNIRPYFKKIWMAKFDGGCSADVLVFRTNGNFSPNYMRYCLSNDSFFDYTMSGVKGSKMPRGDKTYMLNYPIRNVPLNEQNAVAKVLSSIDDKIALNNKINAELEQMAKTLYDYWFIQFEFPDGNEGAYKSSNGPMTYNEVLKREIPVGWDVGCFKDYIETEKSGDWGKDKKEGNYTKEVICIRGADILPLLNNGQISAPDRFILEKNSYKTLKEGDLIVEISGGSPIQSTGRICYINKNTFKRFHTDMICSNFCKAVSLKHPYSIYNFYLEWLRQYNLGILFHFEGKTTGIKNLLFDDFVENFNILIPPMSIQKLFFEKVSPIFDAIQQNNLQMKALAELRDFLLPMLMNGQIKVG